MIQKLKSSIAVTVQNIKNFSLTYTLNDQVNRLLYERDLQAEELLKLKRESDLFRAKNENIEKLEKQLLSIYPDVDDSVVEVFKAEIKRLMDVIEAQAEVIQNKPFVSSELVHLKEPEFVRSTNPIGFIKNYIKFKREFKKYEKDVLDKEKENFVFTVKNDSQGLLIEKEDDKSYKSEYLKESSKHLEVGDKLRRFYYLADIPAYLSPYIFFRLLTSSLPFTLSIFIEPASSSELLKKARQRLSVLEMQQNDRLKAGKGRDQQLDKNIDEVMSFIEELVHEAEKGVVYSLYLQLEAENEAKLNELHKQLQNLAGSMDITFNQYTFGHKQAFKNFLPFTTDHLQENRILQSTAVSYMMPFVSKQLQDPDGILLGVNV